MANVLLTIDMITFETLMVLENKLVAAKQVNREYDNRFGEEGAKTGTVLNLRKPIQSVRTDGQALQLQDAVETSVPVALTTQAQRALAFSSADFKLSIDDFMRRFMYPHIASIANQVDFDVLQNFVNVFNEVGTPGTVPNALLTYLNAGVALDNQAAPRDDERCIILASQMEAQIMDALKGLLNPGGPIGEQYRKGRMAQAIGCDWYMDQNTPNFTVGSYAGGTPIVSANQSGSSISTTGWPESTNILNIGDVVQFAGCYSVNPQNRQSNNVLANWVVTAPVTSDGSGNATIPIAGPNGFGIIVSGPFQTASAVPTTGGAVTVSGASGTGPSPRGLMFHRDFATLVCADLPLWEGVDKASRKADKQLGLSIRLIRAYDINLDRAPTRLDLLYGTATIYPQLACRIAS